VRNQASDVTEIHAIAHAFVNAGNEGKRRRCDVKKRHCRGNNARMYATVIPDKVDQVERRIFTRLLNRRRSHEPSGSDEAR